MFTHECFSMMVCILWVAKLFEFKGNIYGKKKVEKKDKKNNHEWTKGIIEQMLSNNKKIR